MSSRCSSSSLRRRSPCSRSSPSAGAYRPVMPPARDEGCRAQPSVPTGHQSRRERIRTRRPPHVGRARSHQLTDHGHAERGPRAGHQAGPSCRQSHPTRWRGATTTASAIRRERRFADRRGAGGRDRVRHHRRGQRLLAPALGGAGHGMTNPTDLAHRHPAAEVEPRRLDYAHALPDAIQAMQALERVVADSTLEPKLRELVKLRASQLNGCAFCVDMHTKDALAIGEDQQRLNMVAVWREAPDFSSRERAALAWTEALTLLPQTGAPPDDYDWMASEFDVAEQVALTLAIIAINGWNRLSVGLRTPAGSYVSHRQPG